jgi:hypothetical protein
MKPEYLLPCLRKAIITLSYGLTPFYIFRFLTSRNFLIVLCSPFLILQVIAFHEVPY